MTRSLMLIARGIVLAAITWCALVPLVYAQSTAVDYLVAIRYVEANHRSDWNTAFALTHPDAVIRYGELANFFAQFAEAASRSTGEEARMNRNLVNMLFGTSDPAVIRAMTGKTS